MGAADGQAPVSPPSGDPLQRASGTAAGRPGDVGRREHAPPDGRQPARWTTASHSPSRAAFAGQSGSGASAARASSA